MRKRPSVRRIVMWLGAGVCLLIVGLAVKDLTIMRETGRAIGANVLVFYLTPLLLVSLLTMFLWRRERAYGRGFCQACGYDLTGNVSGICSECGTPARVRDQPDLPYTSPELCRKCGTDLTGRYGRPCPDCGAETPKFAPGCCVGCGYSLTEAAAEDRLNLGALAGFVCICCKRYHARRYPPGRCQACGYAIVGDVGEPCPGCGRPAESSP